MIKGIVEDIDTALAKDPAARNRLEVYLPILGFMQYGDIELRIFFGK